MPAGSELNKQRLARGQEDDLASQSNSAVVASTNSNTEEVIYRTGISGSRTPVSHPYVGPNSWIRVMPENGTRCMVSRRAEDGEPYISAYIAENKAKSATLATEQGNYFYRALREGETDITSPGIANVFWSRGGTLELRGGATYMQLSNSDMEIKARAPTHSRAVLGQNLQEVGDEERFGVVVRPGSKNIKFPGQPTIRNIVETIPTFYAKEYLRILRSDGPIPGVTLIEHREGDVIDDSGLPVISTTTGRKLRSMTKYGTSVPGISADLEIDEDGNVVLSLPPSAIKGLALNINGPGNLELLIGKDFLATVTKSVSFQILSSMSVTAATNITLDAPHVSLGLGADTPAVRGQDLMTWLVAHTHPTAVGPSGPPITPPPPAILSTAVTLK
jgi:hypothetical protein